MYQSAKLKQQQASALERKSAGFLHKEEEDRQGNERRMLDHSIEVLPTSQKCEAVPRRARI